MSNHNEKLKVKVFNTAWVRTRKSMLLAGAKFEPFAVATLFAVIEHPQKGIILFDTGHHTQFYNATSKFPYRIHSILTPCDLKEKNNAGNQLLKIGIHPHDVKAIIISHGHADHIPGLIDFPNAKIIINKAELDFICWDNTKHNSVKLLRKSYLKSLYINCRNEIMPIDFTVRGKSHNIFNTAVDLWDDGTMYLVPLPGHTKGQMGLYMNNVESRDLFFIGDAAYLQDNIRYNIPPSKLFQIVYTSPKDFVKTLNMLYELQKANPDLLMIPSHCPETWNMLKTLNMAVE
jgi:glyoxylase-like metal-dependent hydrolase (beta-lactamase superfamily II)